LIKDKARAEIIKRLGQLDVKVSGFQKIFLPAKDKFDEEKRDNPSLEFVAPEAPDFSKLADELGLKLAETGLTALDDESFKVSTFGQATPMESTRGFRSVADVMASAEYFEPHQFQNFVSEEFFTAWKIDDKEEREPSFEEIRDRVLLSYQMMKARERAADRANKLAESLRDVQGDMEKFREKEGGIESITIAPMTLWSSAPMFSMQMMSRRPGRMPTDLPGLRLAGEELRNKTFELKEREVTVAPNQPKEIYYVVLLAKRESASREDFARSRQFVEMQLQTELAQKMYNQWREELRREASGKVALAPAGN
jgi:peptidyl-prolyl cis-trans isomerase D